MTWYAPYEQAEKARAVRAAEWTHPDHPNCCWRSGWHVSSHPVSSYGLDCGGGMSPAARAGVLPQQIEPTWQPPSKGDPA